MAMSRKGSALHILHCTSRPLPGSHFERLEFASHKRMNSRICRCCGEPMSEDGNTLSRNPNVCASCSSMTDGMEENSTACERIRVAPSHEVTSSRSEALARDQREDESAEPGVHHISTWH